MASSPSVSIGEKVRGLFKMAQQGDRSNRGQLYSNVAELFEAHDADINDRERALMRDIMRQLTHEVEMSLRIRLAERLVAQKGNAQHDLVVVLANDRIEVAHPLLVASEVLDDADLVEIVHHRSLQHQLSVAVRHDLSEEVSEALVETDNEDVIVTLLCNQSANFSQEVLAHLVEESERVDRYQRPLLHRQELPTDLVKKMYGWVSDALRHYILENFDIDPAELGEMISDTEAELVDEVQEKAKKVSASQALIDKLYNAGQLTPTFLLKALRQGEVTLFELGLAKLTKIQPPMMKNLIYQPGSENLAVSCKAIGMDRSVFLAIYKHIRQMRDQKTDLTDEETKRINAMYGTLDKGEADQMLRPWRQSGDNVAPPAQPMRTAARLQ
jgi:uncharacterized protein (DUF2336 family)